MNKKNQAEMEVMRQITYNTLIRSLPKGDPREKIIGLLIAGDNEAITKVAKYVETLMRSTQG